MPPEPEARPSPLNMPARRQVPAPPPARQTVARPPASQARPAGAQPELGSDAPNGPVVAGPMGQAVKWTQVPGRNQQKRDVLRTAARAERLDAGANALVMLNRVAVYEVRAADGQVTLPAGGKRAVLQWACEQKLGQDAALVAAVARRRERALRALDRAEGRRARCHLRLIAVPEWRLVVGLGNRANAHEIGLSLHGTYGWPIIPGSSLKGLARAWARTPEAGIAADVIDKVFGTVSREGTVRFLDAIPAGEPVIVEADVLTPHVKPYYEAAGDRERQAAGTLPPPAEHHNPEPTNFLTVRGGYAIDLYGPSQDDLGLAAKCLTQAGHVLGAGAKTAAGYGYLKVRPRPA